MFWTSSVGAVAIGLTLFVGVKYEIAVLSGVVDSITYPFKKTIQLVGQKTKDVGMYFKNIEELTQLNQELKETNDRLVYENTILGQYKKENDHLKTLLEMEQRYRDYPTMGANIIAKDPSNWYKVFNIDKGKMQKLKTSDVVLGQGGLVGHIVQADLLSSQVLAIIDDRSSVGAQVVRTGDTGILRGDVELGEVGLCKMEIPIDSEVVKGDQIITSHLSSIYPPGIPIGIVEEVLSGKNGLTQYAYVRPYVDFKHIQNVLILSNQEE